MKNTAIVFSLLAASVQPALAESCKDKFVALMVLGNKNQPAKTHIVTQVGNLTSENEFWFKSADHYMTVVSKPSSQWVLGYNNTLYFSLDEGKNWKKLRTMDTAANAKAAIASAKKNAKTATNAKCGKEKHNGKEHDTVEADFKSGAALKTANHYKFWVNRETGRIAKAFYKITSAKSVQTTTQTITPAPDLKLPTPE